MTDVTAHLAALDRSYYNVWRKMGDVNGYVAGNIRVASLVAVVEAYRAQQMEIARLESQVAALLDHCPDGECAACAKAMCPYACDMHFHHDGCPSCAEMEATHG